MGVFSRRASESAELVRPEVEAGALGPRRSLDVGGDAHVLTGVDCRGSWYQMEVAGCRVHEKGGGCRQVLGGARAEVVRQVHQRGIEHSDVADRVSVKCIVIELYRRLIAIFVVDANAIVL